MATLIENKVLNINLSMMRVAFGGLKLGLKMSRWELSDPEKTIIRPSAPTMSSLANHSPSNVGSCRTCQSSKRRVRPTSSRGNTCAQKKCPGAYLREATSWTWSITGKSRLPVANLSHWTTLHVGFFDRFAAPSDAMAMDPLHLGSYHEEYTCFVKVSSKKHVVDDCGNVQLPFHYAHASTHNSPGVLSKWTGHTCIPPINQGLPWDQGAYETLLTACQSISSPMVKNLLIQNLVVYNTLFISLCLSWYWSLHFTEMFSLKVNVWQGEHVHSFHSLQVLVSLHRVWW